MRISFVSIVDTQLILQIAVMILNLFTAFRIRRSFFVFKAFARAFARELFMSDYGMGDGGHVFRTC